MIKLMIAKWLQTIRTALSKHLAYRANFLLEVIGPVLAYLVLYYLVWNSIYDQYPAGHQINGFSQQGMIQYQFWNALIIIISQSYFAYNISEDIRLGKISTYLIYPFPFWSFHTCSFLAFQFIQLIIGTFAYIIFYVFDFLPFPGWETILKSLFYSQIVGFFWFSLQYTTGLIGFWLEETWILRVIAQIVTRFLSGSLIPLTFFPETIIAFLKFTPFPYLSFYQIQFFQGNFEGFGTATLLLCFWSCIFWVINHLIWNKGLRLYTAAGM